MNSAQFYSQLNLKALRQRIPLDGTLELTHRCNLRCVHCFCNMPAGDRTAIAEELSAGELCRVLDEIAEAGCLWLLLTGGEPLLRADFPDIYIHAKKRGFIVTLFSNGTLIDEDIVDLLVQWPPRSVEIALYGATAETYEKITGISGSFDRCRRGVALLRERHVRVDLKTAVMTLNKHELPAIKAYAAATGMKFRFDPVLSRRLDGSIKPCQYRLSPEEVLELDVEDPLRAEAWREEFARMEEPKHSGFLYDCGAGLTMFHIDSYGRMSPCDMTRFHNCDLKTRSFRRAWEKEILSFVHMKAESASPCHGCPLTENCGCCLGWSWLEQGNFEEPVSYQCRIAHLRNGVFGLAERRGA